MLPAKARMMSITGGGSRGSGGGGVSCSTQKDTYHWRRKKKKNLYDFDEDFWKYPAQHWAVWFCGGPQSHTGYRRGWKTAWFWGGEGGRTPLTVPRVMHKSKGGDHEGQGHPSPPPPPQHAPGGGIMRQETSNRHSRGESAEPAVASGGISAARWHSGPPTPPLPAPSPTNTRTQAAGRERARERERVHERAPASPPRPL